MHINLTYPSPNCKGSAEKLSLQQTGEFATPFLFNARYQDTDITFSLDDVLCVVKGVIELPTRVPDDTQSVVEQLKPVREDLMRLLQLMDSTYLPPSSFPF